MRRAVKGKVLNGLLSGAAFTALIATSAIAQTSSSSNAPRTVANTSSSPTTASKIEEVTVTANKREESLLSVSAPVSALTASDLSRLQAVSLSDYAAMVPGLNLASDRDGETQIVMRGITTGSYTSSTVATYVDDTPYGSSTSFALGGELTPDLDTSDLQRIEVLRGPQGTLYGASSLGGVVKFVTTPPDLENFGGRLEIDGNSIDGGGDGYGLRATANVPLVTDSLALRVSGYDRHDAGFIDDPNLGKNNVNDTHVTGGHASLLWQPISKLSVDLSVIIQNLNGDGTTDEDVSVVGNKITPIYGDLKQVRYTREPLNIQYRLYSGTVNYDLGWANLISVTSYSTLHQTQIFDETTTFGALAAGLTGIPNFGTSTGSNLKMSKWTQEVRLASPTGDRLEWQAGVFFTHEQSLRLEPTFTFDTVTGATLLPDNALFFASLDGRYTEYAGFGDVTYHFTPQFDIMAGLRYSTNHQHFALSENGFFVGGPSTNIGTSSDHSLTYLVTPSYKFGENNMLYARIATGYRPGGPNAPTPGDLAAGVPATYRPDKLTDYDFGYKAALLEDTLTVDVSAFHIDWRDIQIVTNFNGITSNGNGGTAVSNGVEANATLTPATGLTLSANLAYTDAHLTEDAPGVNGFKGDELPNVPNWAASLNADYDFSLTSTVGAFVGGSVRYTGKRESGFVTGSPATYRRPNLPDYTTVDLRAGVSYDRWTAELYIKNVGDEHGLNNLTSMNLSGFTDPFTASVIQPRTIGLSLSAGF